MAVAIKPFAIDYRIPVPTGYVVINGDQIAKIEATKVLNGLGVPTGDWKIVFYLSDGSEYAIKPGEWTKRFVGDVFEIGI
ncbi:MAG: hypothetical protein ACRD9S_16620 [Pyrinomonadaceae bacterium]